MASSDKTSGRGKSNYGPILPIKSIFPTTTQAPLVRGPQGQSDRGAAGLPLRLPDITLPETIDLGGLAVGPNAGPTTSPASPSGSSSSYSAATIFDKPVQQDSKTLNGWLANWGDDIKTFVSGIPAMMKVAWDSGAYIVKNHEYIKDLIDQPELLTRELDATTRTVIKSFTDTYEHGLGEALYKHPFTVLMDALTVFDLAGGALKAGGKAGLKAAEKGIVSAETKLAARKLINLGNSVQTFPGRAISRPFKATAKAIAKVPFVDKALGRIGFDEVGRDFARRAGSIQLEERAAIEPAWRDLQRNHIPKGLRQQYDDLIDGYIPRETVTDPRVLERYDDFVRWQTESERLWVELGFKTDAELTAARLKQTANKLRDYKIIDGDIYKRDEFNRPVGVHQWALDAAADWIAGRNKWGKSTAPVYKQYTAQRGTFIDELLDSLAKGEGSEEYLKYLSRMEKRTGGKPVSLNPDVWQARQMMQTAELRAAIRIAKEAETLGRPLRAGARMASPGHVIMPKVFGRYLQEGLLPAVEKVYAEAAYAVKKAANEGGDRAKAFLGAIQKAGYDIAGDPKIVGLLEDFKRTAMDDLIEVPAGVGAVLQRMLIGPKGFVRLYDRVLNTWRDALLTFMPRYYVNNLLGNAILLLTGGYLPGTKAAAMNLKELPGEVLGSSGLISESGGPASSLISGILPEAQARARRWANALSYHTDTVPRQLYLKQALHDVIERHAEIGNIITAAQVAEEGVEAIANRLLAARKALHGLGLDELKRMKAAVREGEVEKLALRLDTDPMGRAASLPPKVRETADSIVREIKALERQVSRERVLGNVRRTGLSTRDEVKNATMKQRIAELERERVRLATEAQRQPTRLKHFTSAEAAEKLEAGEVFNASLLPIHGTGSMGKGPKTGKLAGDRIYLSLDDDAWSKALREKPGGRIEEATLENSKLGVTFYDYDKQKWMVEIGGHEEIALAPVTFSLDPNARVLTLDSLEKLREIQKSVGVHWDAEGGAFWRTLERDWDVVEIRNSKELDHKFFRSAAADQAIVLNPEVADIVRGGKSKFDPKPFDSAELDAQIKGLRRQLARPRPKVESVTDPVAARIRELEGQIKLKVSQLQQLSPDIRLSQVMGKDLSELPNMAKIAEMQERRRLLKPYADLAEEAVVDVERFFGPYGRQHPLVRDYIRRIIPFWTFGSTMFKLLFQLPFLRPKSGFIWNQFAKFMVDSLGDDRLPSRYRNYLPIGGTENGEFVFMKISGFNPFEPVTQTDHFANIPIPKIVSPTSNPLVKIAVESLGGYDQFVERPFVGPTDMVTLNGAVWRYDPTTRSWSPVIPQKPLVNSALNQIPHMKILGEIMAASGMPGAAKVFGVSTPQNPDGTYRYDRKVWFGIARAMGFPVTVQNPERVRLQHQLLKRSIASRFRSLANRTDPGTRAEVERILQDLESSIIDED